MNGKRTIPILATALMLATALPLVAQQGPRGDRTGPRQGIMAERGRQDRGPAPRGTQGNRQDRGMMGVERILGLAGPLELTEAQVNQLNTLRLENLRRREETRARMARIRSDLAVGELTVPQAREAMEALRPDADAPLLGDQLQEILTEAQRTKLQETMRQGHPGVRRGDRLGTGEGGIQGR